jgi:hypothetical protein
MANLNSAASNEGIADKIKNWFIPQDPGRPEGISDEELRELRAVAVRETKRTKKIDYSFADNFTEIDAGAAGSFSVSALILSWAWLAYGFMMKRALIVLGVELLLYLITVLIVPHLFDTLIFVIWIIVGIPCGLYGRRWLWEKVGQRINDFWTQSGHNFEQTRLLLSQDVSKRAVKVVLIILCAIPISVLIQYLELNSPKCANSDYYPTVIQVIKNNVSAYINSSVSELDKTLKFELINIESYDEKLGKCVCQGKVMMTNLKDNNITTENIRFEISTSPGGAFSSQFLATVY